MVTVNSVFLVLELMSSCLGLPTNLFSPWLFQRLLPAVTTSDPHYHPDSNTSATKLASYPGSSVPKSPARTPSLRLSYLPSSHRWARLPESELHPTTIYLCKLNKSLKTSPVWLSAFGAWNYLTPTTTPLLKFIVTRTESSFSSKWRGRSVAQIFWVKFLIYFMLGLVKLIHPTKDCYQRLWCMPSMTVYRYIYRP